VSLSRASSAGLSPASPGLSPASDGGVCVMDAG
jgi:hypothetical protein